MSIPKLSLVPRISDHVLSELSIKDHTKYLYFYYRFKTMLQNYENYSQKQINILAARLDWFRNINYLFMTHHKLLGCSYIRETYPALEWPDVSLTTVGALEFAFHYQCNNERPLVFLDYYFNIESDYNCFYCGVPVKRGKYTLRRGLLS